MWSSSAYVRLASIQSISRPVPVGTRRGNGPESAVWRRGEPGEDSGGGGGDSRKSVF